jgi:UDPglucose 6-dehydrogenase
MQFVWINQGNILMKSIGIIGQGFVGSALYEGFKHAFAVNTYDISKGFKRSFIPDWVPRSEEHEDVVIQFVEQVDKTLSCEEGYKSVLSQTDGPIFVCLPTPMNKSGECDLSILRSALKMLDDLSEEVRTVVIKSTVPPGTVDGFNSEFKNNICFNPEFLTERNAVEDFKNQNRIIIGGPEESLEILSQVFESSFPEVPLFKTSSSVAELVKYTTNCFLAVKVSFANELFELCKAINVDYDEVAKHATKDERLGNSHWSVPGPDGKNGFGGSCFPKDLNAILQLCKSNDVDCSTMSAAWETNLRVRPEKDWETLKGRAVSE